MSNLRVNCPGGSYDVLVEPGGLESLGSRIQTVLKPARCLLIADSNIVDNHVSRAASSIDAVGIERVNRRADYINQAIFAHSARWGSTSRSHVSWLNAVHDA